MHRSQSNRTLHGSSQKTSHIGTNPMRAAASNPSLTRANTSRSQPLLKDKNRHQGTRRVFAYYGHALIVFNVYGIPLSFGPYLEYYYNSRFSTTPFYQLTAILACQVACLFCVGFLGPWLYRWNASCSIMAATIIVTVCFALCPHFDQWWLVLVFRGLFMGSMLGILRAVGLLCLASHYKNKFPLASMQGGFAAMLGAASYTALAWAGLRGDNYEGVEMANFGLSFGTLVFACFSLWKSKLYGKLSDTTGQHESAAHRPGSAYFHMGYLMVFFGLFIWPAFPVVLASSPPSNQFPEYGAYLLFATFGTAMASSVYSGSALARRKLGPLNIFLISSLLAGCCTISLPWAPYFYISIAWGCVYGLMLGCILTLHLKVPLAFHGSNTPYHPDMIRNAQRISVMVGVGAAAGIFFAGLFVELVGGFKVALTAWGAIMVVGGCLMALGRWRMIKMWRVAL